MPTMKKLLEANTSSGRRRVTQVFQDFCELSALAIRNVVDRRGFGEREERYLAVAAAYTPEELDRFVAALAQLTLELEAGLSDVLGRMYMSLDLGGNKGLGQYFTPYEVSQLVAALAVGDLVERLREQEFVTLHEPTCGSGGMVIATAETLRDAGVNYQTSMHVTAQDIDITAVHMTYVQLTLLHIPALVAHGNTLTQERRDVWPTPAHVIGGWDSRLRGTSAPERIRCGPPTDDHPNGSTAGAEGKHDYSRGSETLIAAELETETKESK